MVGGMHDRGMHYSGCAWWRHVGGGACVVGGMCGEGPVWWGA